MDNSKLEYLGIAATALLGINPGIRNQCDAKLLGFALQNNVDRFEAEWRAQPQIQTWYALFAIQNGYKWMISFFLEIGLDELLKCNHRLFICALATRNRKIVNFIYNHTKKYYSYRREDILRDISKDIPPHLSPLIRTVYRQSAPPIVRGRRSVQRSVRPQQQAQQQEQDCFIVSVRNPSPV